VYLPGVLGSMQLPGTRVQLMLENSAAPWTIAPFAGGSGTINSLASQSFLQCNAASPEVAPNYFIVECVAVSPGNDWLCVKDCAYGNPNGI
jgi:hypothetical protein